MDPLYKLKHKNLRKTLHQCSKWRSCFTGRKSKSLVKINTIKSKRGIKFELDPAPGEGSGHTAFPLITSREGC